VELVAFVFSVGRTEKDRVEEEQVQAVAEHPVKKGTFHSSTYFPGIPPNGRWPALKGGRQYLECLAEPSKDTASLSRLAADGR
jgi:hypothetical protein